MKKNTTFRDRVYDVVKKIPKGETLTYKEVAIKISAPLSYRAVGSALNKNTNSNVPCHRVIRSDGKVGGFNRGSKKKMQLLREEGAI